MTPGPDESKTQGEGGVEQEAFLRRWSRRKQEARDQPTAPAGVGTADPKASPPELPSIDQLTPESDFRAFLHPGVDEKLRRAALKKLFSDPHFNVMDGLDTYIDDYSKTEPIPAAMLAGLRQAQNILQWAREDEEQRARDEQRTAPASESAPAIELPAPQSGNRAVTPDAAPAPPGGPDAAVKS